MSAEGAGVAITVIVSGLVTGFLYAAGLGLVAVYRTSRVLTFALGSMGGAAVYFASELLIHEVPYGVVFVLVLAAGALLGLVVELGVARPLRERPTVTIAISINQILIIGAEITVTAILLIVTYALVLILRPNGLFGKSEHEIQQPVINSVGNGLSLGETPVQSSAVTGGPGSSVGLGSQPTRTTHLVSLASFHH